MPPVSDTQVRDRIVHVEPVMGTVVSFGVRLSRPPGADAPAGREQLDAAIDAAWATLHGIDRRFSLYRPDSELSRLGRGEVAEADCSPDVRWVLAACDDIARTSGGAFDARRHRADGIVDPSGFVKGWAVELAAEHLTTAGATSWSIAAGGDVLTAGGPGPGPGPGLEGDTPWRVGIRHPGQADRVAAVLEIRGGAVATSGLYERGVHILDPRTGAAPFALRSLTVVGPSRAWADAFATAAFVMGLDGLAWVHDHPGFGALAITADDRVVWTPLVEGLRARDGRADRFPVAATAGYHRPVDAAGPTRGSGIVAGDATIAP